jgi:hypothetical protein
MCRLAVRANVRALREDLVQVAGMPDSACGVLEYAIRVAQQETDASGVALQTFLDLTSGAFVTDWHRPCTREAATSRASARRAGES